MLVEDRPRRGPTGGLAVVGQIAGNDDEPAILGRDLPEGLPQRRLAFVEDSRRMQAVGERPHHRPPVRFAPEADVVEVRVSQDREADHREAGPGAGSASSSGKASHCSCASAEGSSWPIRSTQAEALRAALISMGLGTSNHSSSPSQRSRPG